MMKLKGIVKKYFSNQGYGFIDDNSDRKIFFHCSQVDNLENIGEGAWVEFEIKKDSKGRWEAKNILTLPHDKGANGTYQKSKALPKGVPEPDKQHYFPKDTQQIIDPCDIDNYYLKLNKAAASFQNKDSRKFSFVMLDRKKPPFQVTPVFKNIDFSGLCQRQKSAIADAGFDFIQMRFEPDWRLIVGLGQHSIFETSICLHHIYGFPYIPASALKGLVRNWIITRVFAQVEGNGEKGALSDRGFCKIFGSPKNSIYGNYQGEVCFFDALPIVEPKIVFDVMTPHYGPYYSNGEPPADYYSPNPIDFLAVENTAFIVTVGIKKEDDKPLQTGVFSEKTPMQVVEQWMTECLAEHGAGAKTAVGYGVGELNQV
ncbi:type III-B CRISPR module RAMP protein Cmr6 [Desulfitobacterium chlororespirans]|nr:type III-B CRISPR module RAMP protein Cmr6 [Desulfitobacterium chlororespirans]